MRKWLSEVCIPTETVDPHKNPETEFSYVDISAVDNITKRITGFQTLLGLNAPSRARKLIRTGDVILSTTRPNLNAVAMVPPELDGQVCSTGFCVLRPGTQVNGEFLFVCLQRQEFIKSLVVLVTGALYPAVSDKQVFAQEILLPDLPTQRRIAARLKEQMTGVEAARKAVMEQEKATQMLWDSFIDSIFEPTPKHRTVSFADMIRDLRNGLYKHESHYGRGAFIFKMFNIGRFDGSWNLERVDRVEVSEKERELFGLRQGDILVNRVNSKELVAKSALCGPEQDGAVFESKNMRLRVDESKILPGYACAWLNSRAARRQIDTRSRQIVGQATVNRSDFDSLTLPLPTLSDQAFALTRLYNFTASYRKMTETLSCEAQAIASLPDAYLREAF